MNKTEIFKGGTDELMCGLHTFPVFRLKKKKKKERKGKTRLMATQKLKKWKLGKYSHCLYLDGSKTGEVDHKYAHIWPPVFLPDEVLALLKTN